MKKLLLSLMCGVMVLGVVVGCSNSNKNNDNNQGNNQSVGWNDYTFYINDYKIELPMNFSEFNKLITQNSDYRLGDSEKFYSGSGIDDNKLIPGESEEFYYLNQYGDTIFEQYYLYFTLENETDETLLNEDCTVVGVRVGDLIDPVTSFDKNIKFTSKKIYTGVEMTEDKLVKTFGKYDTFSVSTYRYDKFEYGMSTNYSFQISTKNDVITRLEIKWIDKSTD